MDTEALDYYLSDRSRFDEPIGGAHSGSAGGAACGDLIRISLATREGRVEAVTVAASGCATARAAAAATAELLDDAALADAALISADAVATELGGLSAVGVHAAELAADAAHRALGAAVMEPRELLAPPGVGERVLVATSGGVDSAVAAVLERDGGAEVFAVTLELWSDPANDGEASCCSHDAVRLARSVAHSLGIPHLTVDLRERFAAGVVEPFVAGYAAGSTPNPCILCNGRVRIAPMVDLAERLGCAGLATGHYARLADDGEGALLAAASDEAKDQAYMLSGLPTEVLARLRFPLGEMVKPEVRRLAHERELPVAGRAESQDLCFLAGVGKREFLARHGGLGAPVAEADDADAGATGGEIVDSAGRRLGSHPGHHLFTVGQRRGIGIGAPEPLYVLATDAEANRVVVGTRDQLETSRVGLRDLVLHRDRDRVDGVKLRYRSAVRACSLTAARAEPEAGGAAIELAEGGAAIELAAPTTRPAPGQTAVLYHGDLIVGEGTIA